MIKQRLSKGLRGRCVRGLGMLVAALSLCSVVLLGAAVPAMAKTYDAVTIKIPVSVTLAGDTASDELTSTVTLTPADGVTLMPKNDTVTIKGSGGAYFEFEPTNEVSDNVKGYTYTVKQTTTAADGWTLDTTTYDVTVYVQWNQKEDKLEPVRLIHKTGNPLNLKSDSCAFTNTYTAPAATNDNNATPTTPAAQTTQKTVAGMPKTGDTFTYAWVGVAVVAAILIFCGWRLRSKKGEQK
ncbi:MAG: Spy0128 family protein [Atopobiaceae bacterium]